MKHVRTLAAAILCCSAVSYALLGGFQIHVPPAVPEDRVTAFIHQKPPAGISAGSDAGNSSPAVPSPVIQIG
ncbi:hypothetical protein [Paenibacillus gansuensis]|uniref:Uncharacterized protein n=1 Tax=Paenibacillus gansuensis TaxID=306542 RepID=A0ABW5PD58_9BACL